VAGWGQPQTYSFQCAVEGAPITPSLWPPIRQPLRRSARLWRRNDPLRLTFARHLPFGTASWTTPPPRFSYKHAGSRGNGTGPTSQMDSPSPCGLSPRVGPNCRLAADSPPWRSRANRSGRQVWRNTSPAPRRDPGRVRQSRTTVTQRAANVEEIKLENGGHQPCGSSFAKCPLQAYPWRYLVAACTSQKPLKYFTDGILGGPPSGVRKSTAISTPLPPRLLRRLDPCSAAGVQRLASRGLRPLRRFIHGDGSQCPRFHLPQPLRPAARCFTLGRPGSVNQPKPFRAAAI